MQIDASLSADGFSEFWLTKRDPLGLMDDLAGIFDCQQHHVDTR